MNRITWKLTKQEAEYEYEYEHGRNMATENYLFLGARGGARRLQPRMTRIFLPANYAKRRESWGTRLKIRRLKGETGRESEAAMSRKVLANLEVGLSRIGPEGCLAAGFVCAALGCKGVHTALLVGSAFSREHRESRKSALWEQGTGVREQAEARTTNRSLRLCPRRDEQRQGALGPSHLSTPTEPFQQLSCQRAFASARGAAKSGA